MVLEHEERELEFFFRQRYFFTGEGNGVVNLVKGVVEQGSQRVLVGALGVGAAL